MLYSVLSTSSNYESFIIIVIVFIIISSVFNQPTYTRFSVIKSFIHLFLDQPIDWSYKLLILSHNWLEQMVHFMSSFDHVQLSFWRGALYRHQNDPPRRNDTCGHYRNDPQNVGNGLQKLNNNLVRAFYLFILHIFYGV